MLDFLLDNKRKLLYLILLVSITSIYLGACNYEYASGRRPYNYPNSVWVCETPYITYVVGPNNESIAYLGRESEGQMFELLFRYGEIVDAFSVKQETADASFLFQGQCRFYKNHFTIIIVEDNLWGGEHYSLRFDRVE